MADETLEETRKDPLSFFAAGDDSSDSDSDSDEESNQTSSSQDKSPDSGKPQGSKLTSPHTLFATVGRPAFLNTVLEESAVDWDKLSTKYNPAIYSAVPLVSLEEREKDDTYSDAMISSSPTKYGKELTEIQKHLVVHGKRGSDIRLMAHRESAEEGSGESSAKKAKSEEFRQKEKRKRDIGQATKDKNYVEEEKRLLRQEFASE